MVLVYLPISTYYVFTYIVFFTKQGCITLHAKISAYALYSIHFILYKISYIKNNIFSSNEKPRNSEQFSECSIRFSLFNDLVQWSERKREGKKFVKFIVLPILLSLDHTLSNISKTKLNIYL